MWEFLKEGKHVTAGVLFDSNHVELDRDVLTIIQNKVDSKTRASKNKAMNILLEFHMRQRRANHLIEDGVLAKPPLLSNLVNLKSS